jgi:hypothetical protein
MRCPQCGNETPDDEWNCRWCRINLYWASQHYEDLAGMREQRGLPGNASSPPFLVKAHRDAMDDRSQRGEPVESRVRALARKVMQRKSAPERSASPDPERGDPAHGAHVTPDGSPPA